jgi:hypothetical protein
MKRFIICILIICLFINIIGCNKSESINQVTNTPVLKTSINNITSKPITAHTDDIDSFEDINKNKSTNKPNQIQDNKPLDIVFLDNLFEKCYTASFITHEIQSMDMIENNESTEIFMQWLKDRSSLNKEFYNFTDITVSTKILNSDKRKDTIKYFIYVKVSLEDSSDTEKTMKCGFEYNIILRNENNSFKVVDIVLLDSEYEEYVLSKKK